MPPEQVLTHQKITLVTGAAICSFYKGQTATSAFCPVAGEEWAIAGHLCWYI